MYPNVVDPADEKLNYVVNDLDGTIRRSDTSHYRYAKSRVHEKEIRYSTPSSACGMSSVSEICVPNIRSTRSVVIVTTPVSDRILAISRLETNTESTEEEEPIVVHVDFGLECTKFSQAIVAVQAFPIVTENSATETIVSSFQLVLVDAAATILTLRFTIDTLMPVCVPRVAPNRPIDVRCWSLSDALFGENPNGMISSANYCTKRMISFCSSDILIIALNPHLLAVDIHNEKIQRWSHGNCMDSMRKRQSLGLSSILSKGAEYIWGRSDNFNGVTDMNPVAAVCVAENDGSVVFTLHSDGVIRHWVMSPSSLLPITVQDVESRHIPSPTLWNSDAMMNSIYLSARLYNTNDHQVASRLFVLLVQIQSSIPIPYDAAAIPSLDDSDRRSPIESEINLIAIDGAADQSINEILSDFDNSSPRYSSIRLTAPENAAVLLDMQLDPLSLDRCQLSVIYFMNLNHAVMFCTYSPSSLSILSRDPVIVEDPISTMLMDSIIQKEREKIETVSFYNILLVERKNEPLDHLFYELDLRYLQHLFRPTSPRGNGSVLPPSAHHVYAAMKILEPSICQGEPTSISSDVAMDVALWMQEWRSRDVTDSFHDISEQQHSIDDADVDASYQYPDKAFALEKHEERWRSLLLEVWEQEQVDRVPVAWKLLSCNPNGESIGLLVRPGLISLLSSFGIQRHHHATQLDSLAWELLKHPMYDESISMHECVIQDLIAQNVLEINRAVVEVEQMKEEIKRSYFINDRLLNSLTDDQEMTISVRDRPFESFLPGFGVLSLGVDADVCVRQPYKSLSGIHTRLAAASLLVRGVDAMRRLALARYLILDHVNSSCAADSMYMYLHASAALYVGARMTPSSSISVYVDKLQPLRLDCTSGNLPVLSFLSLRGIIDETIILDPLLIHLSQRLQYENVHSLPFRRFLCLLSRVSLTIILVGKFQNTLVGGMPELGFYPSSSGEIEHPEGAIRLLSVRHSIPLVDDSADISCNRGKLIAMCLISLSRTNNSEIECIKMMTRVFDLLPFDANNFSESMEHLRLLEIQIGERHAIGCSMLKGYIEGATKAIGFLDASDNDVLLERLYGSLFNCALTIEMWDDAFRVWAKLSQRRNRNDKFKRLVQAMVNAGALAELFDGISKLCKGGESLINFYDSVSGALSDMTIKDPYSALMIESETQTDYLLALYTLHSSHGHWRKASEAMDLRYVNARRALASTVPDLRMAQQVRRERLVVDDMALACLSCASAMNMSQNRCSTYLVSSEQECSRYLSLSELELRAKRCGALVKLYKDEACDHAFALRALTSGVDENIISDKDIVQQLFVQGFYIDGIELSAALDRVTSGKPDGRGLLFDTLSHLICNFLLPMALDDLETIKRPTLSQLEVTIEMFKEPRLRLPNVFVHSRAPKLADVERSVIRRLALHLTEVLTMKFTSHDSPLAKEVAQAMLAPDRICTPLPGWLESLLLSGTSPGLLLTGMFAPRSHDSVGYFGDPEVLLTLYTTNGLFKDACRVVTAIFERSNSRVNHVPSRLPEKGEIDYIPFDKIDLLWNFVDMKLQKNFLKREDRIDLETACLSMKKSIEKYFNLLRISEMGQHSARVLS